MTNDNANIQSQTEDTSVQNQDQQGQGVSAQPQNGNPDDGSVSSDPWDRMMDGLDYSYTRGNPGGGEGGDVGTGGDSESGEKNTGGQTDNVLAETGDEDSDQREGASAPYDPFAGLAPEPVFDQSTTQPEGTLADVSDSGQNPFSAVGRELGLGEGVSFQSAQDVADYIRSIQSNPTEGSSVPSVSEETRSTVDNLIQGGYLTQEDLNGRVVSNPFSNMSPEDIAYQSAFYQARQANLNDRQAEAYAKRFIENIKADYDLDEDAESYLMDHRLIGEVTKYQSQVNTMREQAVAKYFQERQQAEQKQAQEAAAKQAERKAFLTELENEIRTMDHLPGTQFVLDPQKKDLLRHLASNPQQIADILQRDIKDPSKRGQLVSRLGAFLFSDDLIKSVRTDGGNYARRNLVSNARNLPGNSRGSSVTTHTQGDKQRPQHSALDQTWRG